MIRNDGTHTIYVIQHLSNPGGFKNPNLPMVWVVTNLDYFAYDLNEPKTIVPFEISGECFKKTGIRGSFKQGEAMTLALALAEKNPERHFRVVEMVISQQTRPVYEVKAPLIAALGEPLNAR